SLEALFSRTAKLPRIELATPVQVIGKTTVQSMQSGIVYGVVGQVNELVARFQKELGEEAKVVATGGLAATLGPLCKVIDAIDPFLTLEGLRLIYELNS
ncbi:MAG: type III pantothenate kinase, partial [Firmicutes bacterium]|nr:type III pantothenate kinase [Bacillota bacterium]